MATIRKLRGRWQAQVRRRGMKPRCKFFDTKFEAEKWARDLEAQVDRFGAAPDTRILETTTLSELLECLYYMDHLVEYRHWEQGKNRPTFQKLFEYFTEHPDVCNFPEGLKAVSELRRHYRELLEIVHASAKSARMTDALANTQIWKTTAGDVGKWSTLHKNVLRDVNFLLLSLFGESLKGASNKGLREALALVIPPGKDQAIHSSLGVRILRQ